MEIAPYLRYYLKKWNLKKNQKIKKSKNNNKTFIFRRRRRRRRRFIRSENSVSLRVWEVASGNQLQKAVFLDMSRPVWRGDLIKPNKWEWGQARHIGLYVARTASEKWLIGCIGKCVDAEKSYLPKPQTFYIGQYYCYQRNSDHRN